MGGVGVLLTAVEAEVKAKLNGRPVTSDEYEQMLISTLLQTIAMVIVARAGAPMLAKLKRSDPGMFFDCFSRIQVSLAPATRTSTVRYADDLNLALHNFARLALA